MYAAGAFTALLLGAITFIQKSEIGAVILVTAMVVNAMLLIAAVHDFLFAAKIERVLGVRETFMKYLESEKKASAK